MRFQSRAPVGSGDGKGSKMYLKINPGEPVKCIITGDEHIFYIKWDNGKSSPAEKGSPGAKFRFRVNVIVKETNGYVAKLWEQGAIVYNTLADLAQDYDLSKTILKVTRNGTGTDTTYSIVPLPGGIDDGTAKYVAAVKLNDVKGGKEPVASKEPNFGDTPPFDSDDELPF